MHLDGQAAAALAERLHSAAFAVSGVERKPYRRSPYAPFRTTIAEQPRARLHGQVHDVVAQRLYENGYITYMRTDYDTVADRDRRGAAGLASCTAPSTYRTRRTYASKVKNAQEAHEGDPRPGGRPVRRPNRGTALRPARGRAAGVQLPDLEAHGRLQMKDATGESVSVKVAGTSTANERPFGASGKISNFYGFLKAYVESSDDQAADRDDQERRLPVLAENDPLTALDLGPAEHATRRPARCAEASLVKELEDREIGRPPTRARSHRDDPRPPLRVQEGRRIICFLAFAVITLLDGASATSSTTPPRRWEAPSTRSPAARRSGWAWLRRLFFGDDDQGNGAAKAAKDAPPTGPRKTPRVTAR